MEYAPRGTALSSPGGGYKASGPGPQYREFEERTPSVPLLQRSLTDQPIMLGPQGGLARVMSTRGHPSGPSGQTADYSSHGDGRRGPINNVLDQLPKHVGPTAKDTQERNLNATQKTVYPEERLREMSMAAVKEYYR